MDVMEIFDSFRDSIVMFCIGVSISMLFVYIAQFYSNVNYNNISITMDSFILGLLIISLFKAKSNSLSAFIVTIIYHIVYILIYIIIMPKIFNSTIVLHSIVPGFFNLFSYDIFALFFIESIIVIISFSCYAHIWETRYQRFS